MKFNNGKIFLLGLGFFGVSEIWSKYNAFVPIFLADRFLMAAGFIGFFMTLNNMAALLIQPAVGALSIRSSFSSPWSRSRCYQHQSQPGMI